MLTTKKTPENTRFAVKKVGPRLIQHVPVDDQEESSENKQVQAKKQTKTPKKGKGKPASFFANKAATALASKGDIGKHNNGKNTGFKAVAAKATKEYGSKAAGNRVAGAILKKIQAKK